MDAEDRACNKVGRLTRFLMKQHNVELPIFSSLPYFGDCMEDKTGGTYSTHRRDYKCLKNVTQNLKIRSNFEVLRIEGKIILKWISSNNNYLFFTY